MKVKQVKHAIRLSPQHIGGVFLRRNYRYFIKHFKKDYGVFENGITLIPWFTHFLPWFSKLLPVSKLEDEAAGWKKVIETIDEKYWLYLEKYNKAGETPKSVYWGIITYEPNELIDFLKKESFH